MTKEQVIHDVLLEAQPTKEFVTSEQVAALALFLCGDDAAQITGANSRSTAAGPRSSCDASDVMPREGAGIQYPANLSVAIRLRLE